MRGRSARDLGEAEVRDIALGLLGRREYGVEELRQRLVHKGAEAAITDRVLKSLIEENLVSDQRFTEMYVRARLSRFFGPLKIRGELRSRGIADPLISQVLPSEQETWFDIASQWAARQRRGELDYAGRAKIYRSLINRGFTSEQANVALNSLNTPD